MDDKAMREGLCAIVKCVVEAARVPADVNADTPLGDGGLWLDSMELLQVVLACEAQFGITFKPAEDLIGDGLETVGTLANVIRRRSPSLSRATSAPEGSS
jgi:acyl carrier protein